MERPKRSCITCRERKILCDRTIPTCQQCGRSKRKCKGYGLRLSWPNAGDKKRAVVAWPSQRGNNRHVSYVSDAQLVSVSTWDLQMHYYLTATSVDATWPVYPLPMTWNPSLFNVGDGDLLQYFQTVASKALPTFGQNPSDLGDILIRIGVDGNSASSTALLRSLLALSSLHRHGVQSQAMELKISSIKALAAAASSKTRLGDKEVVQHVATGMLLCSFEVHQTSCTSSQWTWYISGVRKVLKASTSLLLRSQGDTELSALMDWVYYYEIMARFTLRHWHHEAQRLDPKTTTSIWSDVCTDATATEDHIIGHQDFRRSSSTFATLELLSDACDAIPNRPPSAISTEDRHGYEGLIQLLDWRIQNVQTSHATAGHGEEETATMVELYQLAILVYLNRVSDNILGQEKRTRERIVRAFSIFERLDSCERHFPLFILGCEARTDDERVIVLKLMDRTENRSSSRSLNHIRLMTQAVWAQDDLADKEIDYWDKMTAIISRCFILPSLV